MTTYIWKFLVVDNPLDRRAMEVFLIQSSCEYWKALDDLSGVEDFKAFKKKHSAAYVVSAELAGPLSK